MAKKLTRVEAGNEYVESILARLPEEVREIAASKVFTDDVRNELGERSLRQVEFSRLADETRMARETAEKWKSNLDGWYAGKQQDLEELDRLRTKLAEAPAASAVDDLDVDDFGDRRPPAVDTSKFVSREDMAQQMLQIQKDGLALMSLTPTLSVKHLREFDEVLEIQKVVEHAQAKGMRLESAYDDMVSGRREEVRLASVESQIAKAREEGRQEAIRNSQSMPYPVSSTEPTTLDGLKPDFQKGQALDAAVNDFYTNQQSS